MLYLPINDLVPEKVLDKIVDETIEVVRIVKRFQSNKNKEKMAKL
jgi:hypothetical protein